MHWPISIFLIAFAAAYPNGQKKPDILGIKPPSHIASGYTGHDLKNYKSSEEKDKQRIHKTNFAKDDLVHRFNNNRYHNSEALHGHRFANQYTASSHREDPHSTEYDPKKLIDAGFDISYEKSHEDLENDYHKINQNKYHNIPKHHSLDNSKHTVVPSHRQGVSKFHNKQHSGSIGKQNELPKFPSKHAKVFVPHQNQVFSGKFNEDDNKFELPKQVKSFDPNQSDKETYLQNIRLGYENHAREREGKSSSDGISKTSGVFKNNIDTDKNQKKHSLNGKNDGTQKHKISSSQLSYGGYDGTSQKDKHKDTSYGHSHKEVNDNKSYKPGHSLSSNKDLHGIISDTYRKINHDKGTFSGGSIKHDKHNSQSYSSDGKSHGQHNAYDIKHNGHAKYTDSSIKNEKPHGQYFPSTGKSHGLSETYGKVNNGQGKLSGGYIKHEEHSIKPSGKLHGLPDTYGKGNNDHGKFTGGSIKHEKHYRQSFPPQVKSHGILSTYNKESPVHAKFTGGSIKHGKHHGQSFLSGGKWRGLSHAYNKENQDHGKFIDGSVKDEKHRGQSFSTESKLHSLSDGYGETIHDFHGKFAGGSLKNRGNYFSSADKIHGLSGGSDKVNLGHAKFPSASIKQGKHHDQSYSTGDKLHGVFDTYSTENNDDGKFSGGYKKHHNHQGQYTSNEGKATEIKYSPKTIDYKHAGIGGLYLQDTQGYKHSINDHSQFFETKKKSDSKNDYVKDFSPPVFPSGKTSKHAINYHGLNLKSDNIHKTSFDSSPKLRVNGKSYKNDDKSYIKGIDNSYEQEGRYGDGHNVHHGGHEDVEYGTEHIVDIKFTPVTYEDEASSYESSPVSQKGLHSVKSFDGLVSYGKKDSKHLNCPYGTILSAHGECNYPRVSKNLFVFKAPYTEEKEYYAPVPKIPRPRLDYNLVFVHSPESPKAKDPIIIPPKSTQTVIYVLSKKNEDEQKIIKVPDHTNPDPQVYYIDYKEGENPILPGGYLLQDALSSALSVNGKGLESGAYSDKSNYGSIDLSHEPVTVHHNKVFKAHSGIEYRPSHSAYVKRRANSGIKVAKKKGKNSGVHRALSVGSPKSEKIKAEKFDFSSSSLIKDLLPKDI